MIHCFKNLIDRFKKNNSNEENNNERREILAHLEKSRATKYDIKHYKTTDDDYKLYKKDKENIIHAIQWLKERLQLSTPRHLNESIDKHLKIIEPWQYQPIDGTNSYPFEISTRDSKLFLSGRQRHVYFLSLIHLKEGNFCGFYHELIDFIQDYDRCIDQPINEAEKMAIASLINLGEKNLIS